jgi:hypothetical protein
MPDLEGDSINGSVAGVLLALLVEVAATREEETIGPRLNVVNLGVLRYWKHFLLVSQFLLHCSPKTVYEAYTSPSGTC